MKARLYLFAILLSQFIYTPSVFAQNNQVTCPPGSTSSVCSGINGGTDPITGSGGIFGTIIDIVIWVVTIASVIGVIIGGFRYTTSTGTPQSTSAARNAIIYSLVGLVVAVFARVIVSFVLGEL